MTDFRHRAMRKGAPEVGSGNRMRGFWYSVRTYLKPTAQGRRPDPSSVYRVLSGRSKSRAMLLNIFENCPELLDHPRTCPAVRRIYAEWSVSRTLPESYGKPLENR